ncbi:hypothetical protein B0H11DRAFT_1905392 [Mycena galericulata]|nr:hypothetical protein B0H11DRAFT_1905392 [Mycena galericulata]
MSLGCAPDTLRHCDIKATRLGNKKTEVTNKERTKNDRTIDNGGPLAKSAGGTKTKRDRGIRKRRIERLSSLNGSLEARRRRGPPPFKTDRSTDPKHEYLGANDARVYARSTRIGADREGRVERRSSRVSSTADTVDQTIMRARTACSGSRIQGTAIVSRRVSTTGERSKSNDNARALGMRSTRIGADRERRVGRRSCRVSTTASVANQTTMLARMTSRSPVSFRNPAARSRKSAIYIRFHSGAARAKGGESRTPIAVSVQGSGRRVQRACKKRADLETRGDRGRSEHVARYRRLARLRTWAYMHRFTRSMRIERARRRERSRKRVADRKGSQQRRGSFDASQLGEKPSGLEKDGLRDAGKHGWVPDGEHGAARMNGQRRRSERSMSTTTAADKLQEEILTLTSAYEQALQESVANCARADAARADAQADEIKDLKLRIADLEHKLREQKDKHDKRSEYMASELFALHAMINDKLKYTEKANGVSKGELADRVLVAPTIPPPNILRARTRSAAGGYTKRCAYMWREEQGWHPQGCGVHRGIVGGAYPGHKDSSGVCDDKPPERAQSLRRAWTTASCGRQRVAADGLPDERRASVGGAYE